MDKKLILNALGTMSDEYVEEAIHYKKKKKKAYIPWLIAACLCVLCLTGIPQYTARAVVEEVRQITYLTPEESVQIQPLGVYYPSVLPKGYILTGEGIQLRQSGTDVLSGTYYNEQSGDTLTVTVAAQSYFGVQTWNQLEPTRDGEDIGSVFYRDFGDFAVCYASSNRDLSELEGSAEMLYSSAYFMPCSGGYRLVNSDMFEHVEISSYLSVDADKHSLMFMCYPLSQTLMGTYEFEDNRLIAELKDNNGGTYQFAYTVITRDVMALKHISYSENAAWGPWIEAHLPLDSVYYRNDLWSNESLKIDQY